MQGYRSAQSNCIAAWFSKVIKLHCYQVLVTEVDTKLAAI